MKNACWICNTPFDESKPTKLYLLKEEEQIKVEENIDIETINHKK